MSLISTDPKQWGEAYSAASPKQQYDMMMEALDCPLSSEVVSELDLGDWLLDLRDELVNNNLFEQALTLIEKIQRQQPELYQKEYPYFDKFLIKYYLFRNEPEQVQSAIVRFKANPVQGIDEMFEVLDDLKYYGATEAVMDLCRTTYHPVKNSSQVIGGTEIDLGVVVITHLIEQAYSQLKSNQPVDWDKFLDDVVEYDWSGGEEFVAVIQHDLTGEIQDNRLFLSNFKNNRHQTLRALSLAFYRYMADQKQVPFITSQAIWSGLLEFLEEREFPKKQLAHPDSYFAFSQTALEQYVAQKIGGFFSRRQAMGVATLWGILYVYDFLRSKQVIREEIHQRALAAAKALKVELTNNAKQLWRSDFVHRWLPPDSVPLAEFKAEAELFSASIQNVTPLSDEPGSGTMQSFYKQLTQAAAEYEELDSDENPPQSPAQQLKPMKPPKQRLNPLQQAAKLYGLDELSGKSKKPKK